MTSSVLSDAPLLNLPTILSSAQLESLGITSLTQQQHYHTQCIRSAYRTDKWYNTAKTKCVRMEGVRLSEVEARALYWYIRERQIELRINKQLYKTCDEIKYDKSVHKQRKLQRKNSVTPVNKSDEHTLDSKHNDDHNDIYDKENIDPLTGTSPNHKHDLYEPDHQTNDSGHKQQLVSSDQLFQQKHPLDDNDIDIQQYVTVLRSLRERIFDIIMKSELHKTGFCINVDGISVVDSVVHGYKRTDVQSILADNISSISPDERDDNIESMLYHKSLHSACRLYNDKDVIDILSYSYNISQHLHEQLSLHNSELFDMQIILREWIDELPVRSEYQFRCFIYNRQLTAATQKQSYIYYSDVYNERIELQQRISDYVNQLINQSLIPYEQCIIDILVYDTYIVLLDIKAYESWVNPGCFNWNIHKQQLLSGPYTLRMLDDSKPNVKKSVHPQWQKFIDTQCKSVEYGPITKLYQQYEPMIHGGMILLITICAAVFCNLIGGTNPDNVDEL